MARMGGESTNCLSWRAKEWQRWTVVIALRFPPLLLFKPFLAAANVTIITATGVIALKRNGPLSLPPIFPFRRCSFPGWSLLLFHEPVIVLAAARTLFDKPFVVSQSSGSRTASYLAEYGVTVQVGEPRRRGGKSRGRKVAAQRKVDY